MAWRFVRQPNGLLARWSDVVESFTHANLTPEQALDVALDDVGRRDAAEKIAAGLEDHEPWTIGKKGDGLSRWRECLSQLTLNRNLEEARKIVREMGFADWEDDITPRGPVTAGKP